MVNKLPLSHDNPFDVALFNFIDTHLHLYHQLNFTPNAVTTLSLFTGILCAYLIYKKQYLYAGFAYMISYYLDCVDGKLARKYNMVTKFGDFYDHLSDVTKLVIIVYALYVNDKHKLVKMLLILIPLFILSLFHFGCQQALYDNTSCCLLNNALSDSPTLDIFKLPKETCNTLIHDTKYFGCGTFQLVFTIMLIFLNKISI